MQINQKISNLIREELTSTHILKYSIVLMMLITSISYGQSNPTEVKIFQEAFGLEKKVAIANFLKLEESEKGFWNIYDEYEVERKKLGSERIAIISDYAKSYPNLSEEKILELYKRTQTVKKSFDKLQGNYFKKMKKEVGTGKAAQFWQLESYFSSVIQASIYSEIPFIGENKK